MPNLTVDYDQINLIIVKKFYLIIDSNLRFMSQINELILKLKMAFLKMCSQYTVSETAVLSTIDISVPKTPNTTNLGRTESKY